MKKTASMLMAVAMSLGSIAFAEDKAPDREGFAPDENPNVNPPPGAVQDPGGQRPPPPTFEQWVEGGKKIPQGLVFTGGSPFFNESNGKRREDEDAYKIIFGIPGTPRPGTGGPDPRPEVERPDPRVEEYRKLEQWLEGHKAEEAKAERDLEVKIAEANKNPDKNEVEIHVKNLRAEHDANMAGHAEERKNLESRMAELKEIPEVAICIFPPRPEPETGGPDPRPEVEQPGRPDPRVEEYRKLEQWLEGHKAEAAKLERDLEVKIAEANKNPDKNEVEHHVKDLRAEHDAAMAGHAEERKNLESRMAELIKIPEVVICIFPPRPEPPKKFPPHWGRPPAIQTKDLRPLPEGFAGMGSSTLCAWIERNVKSDLANKDKPKPEPKRPPVVRPPEPPRPELSDDAKAELTGIKSEKKALMEEMKAKLAELDEGASREDTRKAVEEFKKDNEARFAAVKEAADKVHEELKAKRPERKERPEPTEAVKERIAEVKKVEKTLHVARKAVSDKLKEAQDELADKIAEAKKNPPPGWDENEVAIHVKNLVAEQAAARKAALDEFRAAQKEKHDELKAAQKELREEVRNTKETGSSRTSR